MPVRFDASADRLLRTASLPSYNSAYTAMGWVYLVSDLNATVTIFAIDDNIDDIDAINLGSDGVTLQLGVVVGGVSTGPSGTTLSTGTWYHVAIVRASATDCRLYLNGALDIGPDTRDVSGRSAATRLEWGAFASVNLSRFDGRVAAIKIWDAALSAEEVAAEVRSIRPQRLANLNGWWPCFPGSGERARDYSGNGRNWTESGTLTDEDPPPVGWGAAALLVPYAAATATLSGGGTVPVMAGSGTGLTYTSLSTLSGGGTAPVPSGSGAGFQYRSLGTLAGGGTVPVMAGSGTGLTFTAPVYALSGGATIPEPGGSGAGLTFTAAGSFVLSGTGTAPAPTGGGAGLTYTSLSQLSGGGTAPVMAGGGAGLTVVNPTRTLAGGATVAAPAGSGAGLRFFFDLGGGMARPATGGGGMARATPASAGRARGAATGAGRAR